jgi:hypothetical protein
VGISAKGNGTINCFSPLTVLTVPVVTTTGVQEIRNKTYLNATLTGSPTLNGVPLVATSGAQEISEKTLIQPVILEIFTAEGVRGLRIAADSANSRDYVNIRASVGAAIIQALGNSTNVDLEFRSRGDGRFLLRSTAATPKVVIAADTLAANVDVDVDVQPKENGRFTLRGQPVSAKVAVPASGTAAGTPGQWAANATTIFVYTGDGTTHSWGTTALTPM